MNSLSESQVPGSGESLLAGRYHLHLGGETEWSGEGFPAFDFEEQRWVIVRELRGGEELAAEARRLAGFEHPGLQKIFRVWREAGQVFLALEWIAGKPLPAIVARERLSARKLRVFAGQALALLADAHDLGWFHPCLSPEKFFVLGDSFSGEFEIKLADFGVLGACGNRAEFPMECYLPAEQRAGQPADAAANLYSFASVLHYAITGRQPDPGNLPAPPPRIPATFVNWLSPALSPDPCRRPASARAMLEGLDAALAGSGDPGLPAVQVYAPAPPPVAPEPAPAPMAARPPAAAPVPVAARPPAAAPVPVAARPPVAAPRRPAAPNGTPAPRPPAARLPVARPPVPRPPVAAPVVLPPPAPRPAVAGPPAPPAPRMPQAPPTPPTQRKLPAPPTPPAPRMPPTPPAQPMPFKPLIAVPVRSASPSAAIFYAYALPFPPPKKRRVWLVWLLSLAGAAIIGTGGYFLGITFAPRQDDPSAHSQPTPAPPQPTVVGVSDLAALRGLSDQLVSVTGVIVSVAEDEGTKYRSVYFARKPEDAAVPFIPPDKPGGLSTDKLRSWVGKSVTATGAVHYYKGIFYVNVQSPDDLKLQ